MTFFKTKNKNNSPHIPLTVEERLVILARGRGCFVGLSTVYYSISLCSYLSTTQTEKATDLRLVLRSLLRSIGSSSWSSSSYQSSWSSSSYQSLWSSSSYQSLWSSSSYQSSWPSSSYQSSGFFKAFLTVHRGVGFLLHYLYRITVRSDAPETKL